MAKRDEKYTVVEDAAPSDDQLEKNMIVLYRSASANTNNNRSLSSTPTPTTPLSPEMQQHQQQSQSVIVTYRLGRIVDINDQKPKYFRVQPLDDEDTGKNELNNSSNGSGSEWVKRPSIRLLKPPWFSEYKAELGLKSGLDLHINMIIAKRPTAPTPTQPTVYPSNLVTSAQHNMNNNQLLSALIQQHLIANSMAAAAAANSSQVPKSAPPHLYNATGDLSNYNNMMMQQLHRFNSIGNGTTTLGNLSSPTLASVTINAAAASTPAPTSMNKLNNKLTSVANQMNSNENQGHNSTSSSNSNNSQTLSSNSTINSSANSGNRQSNLVSSIFQQQELKQQKSSSKGKLLFV